MCHFLQHRWTYDGSDITFTIKVRLKWLYCHDQIFLSYNCTDYIGMTLILKLRTLGYGYIATIRSLEGTDVMVISSKFGLLNVTDVTVIPLKLGLPELQM